MEFYGGGGPQNGKSRIQVNSGRSYIGESTDYFPGSRRYRYVQNGVTHYFYSDRDWTNLKAKRTSKIILILSIIPFLLAGIIPIKASIHIPKKLEATSSIIIQDNLGIADRSVLEPALKEYQDVTGITPSVFTAVKIDGDNHSKIKKDKYDLYVNMIKEEQYLLIIYTADSNNTSDYHFELAMGAKTSNILNSQEVKSLNSNLNNNLLDTSTSFSEDIANALKESAESSMKFKMSSGAIFFISVWYGFIALWLFLALKPVKPKINGYKGETIELDSEQPAPEPLVRKEYVKSSSEQFFKNKQSFNNKPTFDNESVPQSTLLFNRTTCRYCGKTFEIDNEYRCPNCGAQLERWQIEEAKNKLK